MFLLKIGVPQTCFEIALTWCLFQSRPDFGYRKDPLGTTCRISLTISSRKNGYLAKENTMIGPPARGGARHDIMLPGHQRINIITLGKLSQPSYRTEIHIQLVS